jgi:hypothetical protein
MINDNEVGFSDMYLAVSLLYEGVTYLRIEPDDKDPRKKIFIFENSPEVERIKAERANGTFLVSAIQYEDALRRVRSLIHA